MCDILLSLKATSACHTDFSCFSPVTAELNTLSSSMTSQKRLYIAAKGFPPVHTLLLAARVHVRCDVCLFKGGLPEMAVAEALRHLKQASTDNEKIAALLLVSCAWSLYHCSHSIPHTLQVSKVVRAGEVSEEQRRHIFNAVGFSFVNRLLNTSVCLCAYVYSVCTYMSTAPPEEEADGSSDGPVSGYQRLGVTLLACFTTDPQLVHCTDECCC